MSEKVTPDWTPVDPRTRILRFVAILSSLVIVFASWRVLNVEIGSVMEAPEGMNDLFIRMYPPDVGYSNELIQPLIETINISVLGTTLAIVIALPVAYIGAANTTPNRITLAIGKFLIAFSRSVNVIIWALIFIVIFGPGALAGVFAIGLRSVGFIAKLMGEAIEEINRDQIEAIRATGASGIEVLTYGVVPQVKPTFIGVTTYRWDTNIRHATVIGFVGAGGIGQKLTNSIDFFAWDQVLTILIAIFGVVIFSEIVSAQMRKKFS